jgi:hypothetical protein
VRGVHGPTTGERANMRWRITCGLCRQGEVVGGCEAVPFLIIILLLILIWDQPINFIVQYYWLGHCGVLNYLPCNFD